MYRAHACCTAVCSSCGKHLVWKLCRLILDAGCTKASEERRRMLTECIIGTLEPGRTRSERVGRARGCTTSRIPYRRKSMFERASKHANQSRYDIEDPFQDKTDVCVHAYLACATYDPTNHTYALEHVCNACRRLSTFCG